MPLGAARINLISKHFAVVAEAEVIRYKKGITANGNAQIDTAQSKFGGSSALFDGTGDYLLVSPASDFAFGTGDFTVEFFVRFSTLDVTNILYDYRPSGGTNFILYLNSSNTIIFNNGSDRISVGQSLSTGVWYHYAITRSGTSTKLFRDGTQIGSTYTDSTNYTGGSGDLRLGWNSVTGQFAAYFNGHMDEVRISNTARYTTSFTPSTTPFVNDANTKLLLHMDGTDASTVFVDDNGSGRRAAGIYRVTAGNISTTQSKFGGSSLYFPETSGQALNANYDAIAAGLTNNGDFTIELWAYFTKLPSSGDGGYMMFYSHSPEPYVLFQNSSIAVGAGGYPSWTVSPSFTTNTWYHIAISRSSGSMRAFVNGTQQGSTTTGSTYNYIPYQNNLSTRFGKFGDDRGRWQGYMDEIRFSSVARYTANFTAPTAPFVNDANTLLLIHADGTDASTVFVDDNGSGRAKVGVQAIGNAQVDTAQSKFGGASALFDGTGDYLSITDISNLGFTDDFTIEFFIRGSTLNQYNVLYSNFNASFNGLYFGYWHTANKFSVYINGSERVSATTTLSTNTWYHICLVRNSGILTVYQDGVSKGTGSYSGTILTPTISAIGINTDGLQHGWNGHIDEVRVSNTARYTSSFTPSTTQFQNDDNTVLLLHMDGTDGSTVFIDDNGVTPNHSY